MKDRSNKICLIFLFYAVFLLSSFATKRVFYIATERPSVTYYNHKYGANFSLTAYRYSRRDPMYYINIYVETLANFDNNITMNFYAFPYPVNGPLFMELHYKWCDMVFKDEIIGALLRNYLPPTCPTPKGIYKISNMTTAKIPSFFVEHLPFSKARLFVNATIFNEKLAEGHIDIEVKKKNI